MAKIRTMARAPRRNFRSLPPPAPPSFGGGSAIFKRFEEDFSLFHVSLVCLHYLARDSVVLSDVDFSVNQKGRHEKKLCENSRKKIFVFRSSKIIDLKKRIIWDLKIFALFHPFSQK